MVDHRTRAYIAKYTEKKYQKQIDRLASKIKQLEKEVAKLKKAVKKQ